MRKLPYLLLATALLAEWRQTGLAQGSTQSISQTKYILVGLEVSPFVKITFPTWTRQCTLVLPTGPVCTTPVVT